MPNVQATRVPVSDLTPEPHVVDDVLRGEFRAERPGSGGRSALIVQSVFRGVITGARVLSGPEERRRAGTARPLLVAGTALLLLAMGTFAAVAIVAPPRVPSQARALDVLFFGNLLAGGILIARGLRRRRLGRAIASDFIIGSAAGVDAPVDEHYISANSHRLVTSLGDSYVLHATPQMQGEFRVADEVFPIDQLLRGQGPALRLPAGGCARVSCGDMTFIVATIDAPEPLATPALRWRPDRDPYTVGAALALSLFLLMVFTVPPDPRSLSLDLLSNESHLVRFRIAPPVEDVKLTPSESPGATAAAGKAGKAHVGEAGSMGDKNSKARDHRFAIVGPKENHDIRLAKEAAIETARTAGILGVFKRMDGPVASVFAREAALGDAAENVLGNLVGAEIGSAWGNGGLDSHGTGAGGGGTGEATLGVGRLGTIGPGTGPEGNGPGRYGRMAGQLRSRRPTTPDIYIGEASVRGSLDKEIIRRTIRRHINEIKFCYEEELTRRPNLSGRIMVQFAIAGTGQVISSVLQSSTIGNARVETCAVQAVKRWPFPQPQGGGLVMVSYPFVLAPAGS